MTNSDTASTINNNRTGGADLTAVHDLTIGGDVVGRDKITSIAGDNVEGDKIVYTGDQQYDVHGLASPYLGLQSFTYADHAKYAGREKLIAETVARLTSPDKLLALLFVTGASGSGKSSFVQAGVLPSLEKHYAALSVKWAVFRPSRDPLAALIDALWRQLGLPQFDATADFGDFLKTHTPPQQINVIVIDQFEELFTPQADIPSRDALFDLLTHLPPFRSTRTHILVTMRADYLPELFALRELYDIAKCGIDLRAMSVDELREAIQQPLRAEHPGKDKRFQSELVERLAKDAAEDAAYLPLLQVTLEEIWRKGMLTLGAYTNLADAIKQRADKVLEYQDYDAAQPSQPRSPEEKAAILNLCLDLVDVSLDDETRRDVRRRRLKDELISGAPERARLIDTLAQARLLSVSTGSDEPTHAEVDLIHETLLSNWDRLRQMIVERRYELRQRVRFEQQLKEWIGQDRSDDYLLSGVHLAEVHELEHRNDVVLRSVGAEGFVRRSIDREKTEKQREKIRQKQEIRRLTRRNRLILSVSVVSVLLFSVALFFASQSNDRATEAKSQIGRLIDFLSGKPKNGDPLPLGQPVTIINNLANEVFVIASSTEQVGVDFVPPIENLNDMKTWIEMQRNVILKKSYAPGGGIKIEARVTLPNVLPHRTGQLLVVVPNETPLTIESATGSIIVYGRTGSVYASTGGGMIHVDGAKGSMNLEATSEIFFAGILEAGRNYFTTTNTSPITIMVPRYYTTTLSANTISNTIAVQFPAIVASETSAVCGVFSHGPLHITRATDFGHPMRGQVTFSPDGDQLTELVSIKGFVAPDYFIFDSNTPSVHLDLPDTSIFANQIMFDSTSTGSVRPLTPSSQVTFPSNYQIDTFTGATPSQPHPTTTVSPISGVSSRKSVHCPSSVPYPFISSAPIIITATSNGGPIRLYHNLP